MCALRPFSNSHNEGALQESSILELAASVGIWLSGCTGSQPRPAIQASTLAQSCRHRHGTVVQQRREGMRTDCSYQISRRPADLGRHDRMLEALVRLHVLECISWRAQVPAKSCDALPVGQLETGGGLLGQAPEYDFCRRWPCVQIGQIASPQN